MAALIYNLTKNAMQSGKALENQWILKFEPEMEKLIEPLMGYTSSRDMKQQLCLRFNSRQDAIDFAVKNGIPYRLEEANKALRTRVSYSDNFRPNRQQPWTH